MLGGIAVLAEHGVSASSKSAPKSPFLLRSRAMKSCTPLAAFSLWSFLTNLLNQARYALNFRCLYSAQLLLSISLTALMMLTLVCFACG